MLALQNVNTVIGIGQPLIDNIFFLKPGKQVKDLPFPKQFKNEAELTAFVKTHEDFFDTSKTVRRVGDVTLNTLYLFGLAYANKPERLAEYFGCVGHDAKDDWSFSENNPALKCRLLKREGATGFFVQFKEADSEVVHSPYPTIGVSTHLFFEEFKQQYDSVLTPSTLVVMPAFIAQYPDNFLKKAITYFHEKEVPVSLNLGAEFIVDVRREKLLAIIDKVTHICGNMQEARALTQKKKEAPEEVMKALKEIAPQAVLTITNSGEGAYLCNPGQEALLIPAKKIAKEKIVNPLGCGDTHQGTFLWAMQQGKEPSEAIKLANAASAKVLKIPAAQFPHEKWKKIERLA